MKHPVVIPGACETVVVQVKPVAVAMFNTVCAAVVCASIILPDPNAIERVLVLDELNIPVVILKLLRDSAPVVNVIV